jgi:hypothetical protein
MRDHVRFQSDQFAPPDREPWQIAGERFGYALATWVSACLGERGFVVDIPVPEDWGWELGVKQDGRAVRIGCQNIEGSVSRWLIWLDVTENGGPIRRLLRRAGSSIAPNAAYGIAAAIHTALHANPHTSEIEWFRVADSGEELDHAATPI